MQSFPPHHGALPAPTLQEGRDVPRLGSQHLAAHVSVGHSLLPLARPGGSGVAMSARIASKTALNYASCFFSSSSSRRAGSRLVAIISRGWTNARMISMFTSAAAPQGPLRRRARAPLLGAFASWRETVLRRVARSPLKALRPRCRSPAAPAPYSAPRPRPPVR